MTRVRKSDGGSKKRNWKATALGSTGFITTASLAAVAATGALLLTSIGSNALRSSKALKWMQPVVSLLSLGSLSTTTTTSFYSKRAKTPSTANVKNQDSGTTTPAGSSAMKLGINLAGLGYFTNQRSFMNLLAGSEWNLIANGQWVDMPAQYLDANKNVIGLGQDEYAVRPLSTPTKAFLGLSVDIICRWQGSATVNPWGSGNKNIRISSQSLTFTYVPDANGMGQLRISNINQGDPIRNIDCREADADPNAMFDPTFLDEVRRFNTVRFVKWQRAVEANTPVTWATRTKPGDGIIDGKDSVPVEYMVRLANETQTNPWFNMPWNADDDYIRRFAEYVKQNLDPNLKAYIETSNEVWNWAYPVTRQALDEGKAEGLHTSSDGHAMLYRYAEKTGQVMDIWSSVFAGQMSRIVRVAATQNWAWPSQVVLEFRDTPTKVDALATAPYFAANLTAGQLSTKTAMDEFFSTTLPADIKVRFDTLKEQKSIAAQYNLRLVTYEAGQHVISPDDLDQMAKIQRDPRMGQLYTQYLTRWNNELGDLMILFANTGKIDRWGAWGLREYTGQSLAEAPKANAVDLFSKSYAIK